MRGDGLGARGDSPGTLAPVGRQHTSTLATAAAEARANRQPLEPEPTAAPVSTGSVERSLSPGPAETVPPITKESVVAAATPDRSEITQSEVERRHAIVNPRVARAKRLRRAMTRRPKAPGSPVEAFFTSFFAKN
jgi:hypothetical protein